MYHASASIWALVLIGVAGISGTTALVLHRGGVAAGIRSAGTIGSAAAIFVAGPIAVSGALAGRTSTTRRTARRHRGSA